MWTWVAHIKFQSDLCYTESLSQRSNLACKSKIEKLTTFLNLHITYDLYHAWGSVTTLTQVLIQSHWWMCALWQLGVRTWFIVRIEMCLLLQWTSLWYSVPSHTPCGIPASECRRCLDYIQDLQNQTFWRCYGNTEPESPMTLIHIKVWEPQMLCVYIDVHVSILDTYSG